MTSHLRQMVLMKARTGTGLYSLACLLMISSVCSTCVPFMCLRCNLTHSPGISATGLLDKAMCDTLCSDTHQCFNATVQQQCSKDFKVLLNTSSGFKVVEGADLIIECAHNLPVEPKIPLVFVWLMDGVSLTGENSSQLTVKKVGIATSGKNKYACTIQSPCGNFTSDPKEIEFEDTTLLVIVICGVSAVVLILAMGIGMKIMLKKEFAKTKNRRQQNAQNLQRTTTTE
ncbi:uncharacterized protein isoform X2 [Salmo salar]|uniref:Uncharacterized protein isoform X2 n=1 Tax=Salmo salar TaxID=8030 RepID=A0A1S3SUN3_SALSA|nr:uncharacterized protein LOC106611910 isoform X2 [Salmo salar]|eukprot:XP_014068045.1 PREDICTED: uncharacterized protein LOC106611910 isoform X2 [Salmo salar]